MRHRHKIVQKSGERGFTLVEMIVAVGLFAVVMIISISTLLSLINANRKAQALQSVMNNLNVTLDGMVRAMRQGSNFRCGSVNFANPNCTSIAGTVIFFERYGGNPAVTTDDWAYAFDTDGSKCGAGRFCKSVDGGTSYLALTAPEVTIDSVSMYVVGATPRDNLQPKALIVVKGSAGLPRLDVRTTFHIQATAVQRVLDI